MKRAITFSILVIAVAALLVGLGTLAYYSDSATSTANTFTAGTLLFNIKDPNTVGHQAFNVTGMKPGVAEISCVAVANDSTEGMAMKWHAWIEGTSGTLGPALEARVILNPSAGCASADASIAGYVKAGTPNEVITDWTSFASLGSGNTVLQWVHAGGYDYLPGWASVYRIEVRIKPAAGNEFQGATYTGDLNFGATQADNPGW